ncbi:hypothetical protein [Amycolatopsis sp. cg9]|uniref:hypothetical protein n=1 Tax=Amycolatopsis sp. cg9 TaxID=3238801 RepID=UPI003524E93A
MSTASTRRPGEGNEMDDAWPTARQALADAGATVTYLRLLPDVPPPSSGAAASSPDGAADTGEVHVALLDTSVEPRTLCGRPADRGRIEVVDALGDRPCLRCVARAAELACLAGGNRR